MYLSGAAGRPGQDLPSLGIGLMLQPGNGYLSVVEKYPFWAADNGCFAQGDKFDIPKWYRWLKRVPRAGLLFAVAPDVFPDAAATLERSRPIFPVLRAMGLPIAYVAQNGSEHIDPPWNELDWLFLGGTTEWKLGPAARRLTMEAKNMGKRVHMGRVNSERRLRYAAMIDCDSADGTFLKYRNRGGANGLPDLAAWFRQPMLPLAE